jgi:UDP-3-O-[3-hydroxymyristoyl] glucosamine N-acyltransferase
MEFTALELSRLLKGRLEGNPSVKVRKPAKIEDGEEGDVCFLANPKYLSYAYTTNASVIIINEEQIFDQPVHSSIIRVRDAYTSFSFILDQYKISSNGSDNGIEKHAYVSFNAKLGKNVNVGAFAFIDDDAEIGDNSIVSTNVVIGKHVKIGTRTLLAPGVIILDGCIIGDDCLIQAGAVIGSDGFGFAPQADGTYKKVAQTGNVIIEDDVEIGANTTIDRATMGSTIIRKGAKLDNLVQIAHNVEVGENTVIAAQTGISGSTKIGKNCMLGGQVGIVGHLIIADGTRINAQSGVSKSIKENNIAITGSPAFDYNASMRSQVIYRKLPELLARITELEEKIKALQTT